MGESRKTKSAVSRIRNFLFTEHIWFPKAERNTWELALKSDVLYVNTNKPLSLSLAFSPATQERFVDLAKETGAGQAFQKLHTQFPCWQHNPLLCRCQGTHTAQLLPLQQTGKEAHVGEAECQRV